MFKIKPSKATIVTVSPRTSWGVISREIASKLIQAIKTTIPIPLTNAAKASARPKPKESLADGGLLEITCARTAKNNPAASVTI